MKAENEALKARAATAEAPTTAALESLARRLRALEAGGGQPFGVEKAPARAAGGVNARGRVLESGRQRYFA